MVVRTDRGGEKSLSITVNLKMWDLKRWILKEFEPEPFFLEFLFDDERNVVEYMK